MLRRIGDIAKQLADGAKSRALVEECLARINDPAGEGGRVFLKVHAEPALAAADFYDRLRAHGHAPSPFAGIPVSIKDLFDIAGDVTTAGSVVLRDAPAATQDAPSVARLRAAGFIPIGRTNMTEFAFSGLGINPHYGTPANAYDRKAARIPGGSSSGAAVSVTDGMAVGRARHRHRRLVPHSGGALRHRRLQADGAARADAGRVPALDLARFDRADRADGCVLRHSRRGAGRRAVADLADFPLGGLRLAVPQTMVLDGVAPDVAQAFEAALATLGKAGAKIVDLPLRELSELGTINAKGGPSAAESYAAHRGLIAKGETQYDPRVLVRILRGREQDAADYIELLAARTDFIRRARGDHRALRRPGDADHADHGAAHRGPQAGRCLSPRQRGDAAQSVGGEFPRPLLDLDPLPPRGRRTGRPDADRRARRGPPAAGDRGGDGKGRIASRELIH